VKKQMLALVIFLALLAVISEIVMLGCKGKPATVAATPIPGTIQVVVDGEVKDNLKLADVDALPSVEFTLYVQSYHGVPIADIVNRYAAEGSLSESSVIKVQGADGKVASTTWGALTAAKPGLYLVKSTDAYRLIGETPGLASQDAFISTVVRIEAVSKG